MLFDNLPLPLPWYQQVTHQDRFRQNAAMNAVITQLGPKDGILPFQLRKPSFSTLPATWVIKCAANGKLQDYIDGFEDPTVVDLSSFIFTALQWLTLHNPDEDGGGDYDYIIFKNENNSLDMITGTFPDGLPPGVYYMQMDFGPGGHDQPELGGKWCSETFRVPVDRFTWDVPAQDCNYPCFKWSHNSDIIPIHYDSDEEQPFYNLLYLDTWITASEPVYVTQGKNDGFEEYFPQFQKAVIKYRISTIIPDYIKVSLYMFLLHENKYLFTEHQLREGKIKNLEVSSTLSDDGALSIVEILFEQMSLTVKTNCDINMVVPLGYEVGGGPYVLTVHACFDSGAITVKMTTFPDGVYGELWGYVGAGPTYGLLIPYISRTDLLTGWNGTVGPPASYSHYKIIIRTFTFVVGESTVAGPVFDLC